MTAARVRLFDQQVVGALDAVIEHARQVFEQSLIDHHAPADAVEDLRDFNRAYAETWRAHTLAHLRATVLDEWPCAATVH